MTERERILAVYDGKTPDRVPFMLDLSHWFYHKHQLPWDLSAPYTEPETDLIDYHKRMGVGFYLANNAAFHNASFADGVRAETKKVDHDGAPEIVWTLETGNGVVSRSRIWEPGSYSWGMKDWGVETEDDLRVLGEALSAKTYTPNWTHHQAWNDRVGDDGVVYLSVGYSAIGELLNYWMGIERTIYACVDWPETMRTFIDSVNENKLRLIDLCRESPAEIVIMGDNISSDVQPPSFFAEWSKPYYTEAIKRLHAAGKKVAVHIDGKLRGALKMVRETGADCADAVTPAPLGDLSSAECRAEAGPTFILSGGVPPNLWLPSSPIEAFERSVKQWLALKDETPALIANAGDQVPPGAEEGRIAVMRDLVERHGNYR